MFDGAKHLKLVVVPEHFMSNPLLEFQGKYDLLTEEVIKTQRSFATYKGWRFTAYRIKNKWAIISGAGSYHKYFNNGINNYTDFNRIQVAETIDRMSSELGLLPFMEKMNNVEFGINIVIPFSVTDVLNSLLTYKGIPFVRPIENPNYYQCKTREFIIKIYDKGKEYNLKENLLRFEIKVNSMNYLKTKGIKLKVMADLLNEENYPKIKSLLLKTFQTILFRDITVCHNRLAEREKILYLQGCLNTHWKRPERRSVSSTEVYESVRKKQKRDEDDFRRLFAPTFLELLQDLIGQKWDELAFSSPEDLIKIKKFESKWWKRQIEEETKYLLNEYDLSNQLILSQIDTSHVNSIWNFDSTISLVQDNEKHVLGSNNAITSFMNNILRQLSNWKVKSLYHLFSIENTNNC